MLSMNLDWLKKLWNFVDSLNSTLKTFIIVILCSIAVVQYVEYNNKQVLQDHEASLQDDNIKKEIQAMEIASKINDYMLHIQNEADGNFNVILLSYHNSTHSLQGLSYIYLNCISEVPDDYTVPVIRQYWKDLEYSYYVDELQKIHNEGYIRIDNVDTFNSIFPKMCRQLRMCEAQAAIIYPLQGTYLPSGLVLILFKEPLVDNGTRHNDQIAPWIQKLSILLNR